MAKKTPRKRTRTSKRPAKRSSRRTKHASEALLQKQILDMEYAHASLLLPRIPDDSDPTVTTALAAVSRASRGTSFQLRMPPKATSSALKKIGMQDMETLQSTRQPGSNHGTFAQLNSLGMTAAFFRQESDEANAMTELAQEYDFVSNFPLAIPARARLEDVPETRGRAALAASEWPETSGVIAAHSAGIRGAGVLVGVLDTGVDADHREFEDSTIAYRYVSFFPNSPWWPPRDVRGFDTDGHGTHVSGILAGKNVGVAPEASLYVASVIESETTRTSLIRVASGLNWMLRQFSRPDTEHLPAVLNMSLGFPSKAPSGIPNSEYKLRLKAMRMLLRSLIQANVLPMVAIGNEGAGEFGFPGGFKDVLGVGAVNFDHVIADFSGSGKPPGEGVQKPDLVGYGVGIYSSVERDYQGQSIYQRFNGTSMATPFAAGIAALYRCEQPQLTVAEVRDKMVSEAMKIAGQPASRVGAGVARFVPK